MNLLLSDVAIDNRASPSHIQIILKQSKGDQFAKGAQIHLGGTTHAVCSVQAPVQCPGLLLPILRQHMVDKRFVRHSTQRRVIGAVDGFFSVQYSQL